ncbi:MAG TPA: iron-siderophore ABC transporter substrate-binding protein [Chloroflexota bacterium]
MPATPRRVVVLDLGELDMALAVGVKPVAAATYTLDAEYPAQLKERAVGIPRVGTVDQPNLEAIAALDPDVILSNKVRHERIYDKLSQIAPTVLAEGVGAPWKQSFAVHAEALGKAAEGERVMQTYYRRLDEFKQAMGERLGQTHVSIVRSFPDHVRIYMKQSFIGTIVEDAGLPRPPAQDKDIFMERATEERIPDLDGDVIFLLYYNRQQGEQLSRLMQHPLWAQLKAVKAGRVYEVSDDVWGLGLGPLAATLVIDDLFAYLVEGGR